MARIEKRENKTGTTFKVVWYRGGKRQPPLTFPTELKAKEWKAAVEMTKGDPNAAAEIMERARSQAPTFQEAYQHHVDRMRTAPLTKQTYASYMRNHLTPAFGSVPVDRISPDDVRHLIVTMEDKGRAAKMITNVCGLLTAVMDHSVQQGWIAANPYNHRMLPAAPPRNERDMFLTVAEARQIIALLPAHHQDPCWLLLATGLRPSEMRALTVEDVTLTAKQPTVRVNKAMKDDRVKGEYVGPPKSKKSIRSAGLPPSSLEMLRPHVGGRSPIDPLFTGSTGKRLNASSLRRSWRNAVSAAKNLEELPLTKSPSLYSLRHTHASIMLDAGMSIFALSRHMGHGSVQVTEDVYAHLMPDAHYQAANFAAKALAEDVVVAELEPA